MTLTNALGWTLVHFLWQGALIAVILAAVLACLRNASARIRYAVGCVALLLMVSCVVATFVSLRVDGLGRERSLTVAAQIPPTFSHAFLPSRDGDGAVDYLPGLVWAWFGGVMALSLRSLGGWAAANRFARRGTWSAEEVWEERFAALTKRLRISKPVTLAVSAIAQVPAAVGWLRPVVLIPASVFLGLTAEQIEALLAHELAHVRRHDYLVNLLQTAAETLLFYHPAVWWVSRVIRQERENCCDDLAVEICGSRLTYVQALTELEQMRVATPRLAMAADGGSLVNRVRRLLHLKESRRAPMGWVAGAAVVVLLGAGIAVNVFAQRSDSKPAPVAPPAVATLDSPEPLEAPDPPEPPDPPDPPEPQAAANASTTWLDQIEAEGYRDLSVDQLVALRVQGVNGQYIHELRAAGLQPTAEELIALKVQGVTGDYVSQLKQASLRNLTASELVALKVQGVDPAWLRQIQALGFSNTPAEQIVGLRVQGITPDFIRTAQRRFRDITIDQLIQLKVAGIFETPKGK